MQRTGPAWVRIAGKWQQFRRQDRRRWGLLTDDDLEQIQGERDILAGRIQERYGFAREDANRQIDEWLEKPQVRVLQ
jgi:uncharacterized protein YjbJ (UPF0337 family)